MSRVREAWARGAARGCAWALPRYGCAWPHCRAAAARARALRRQPTRCRGRPQPRISSPWTAAAPRRPRRSVALRLLRQRFLNIEPFLAQAGVVGVDERLARRLVVHDQTIVARSSRLGARAADSVETRKQRPRGSESALVSNGQCRSLRVMGDASNELALWLCCAARFGDSSGARHVSRSRGAGRAGCACRCHEVKSAASAEACSPSGVECVR